MNKINYRRLAFSALVSSIALVAGEIIFLILLRQKILAAREAAHLPAVTPNPVLGVVETLLLGSLLAWSYASIRPRFGPGIVTAARAAVPIWLCAGVLGTIHLINDNLGFPVSLLVIITITMLPMLLCASIIGASVYRE